MFSDYEIKETTKQAADKILDAFQILIGGLAAAGEARIPTSRDSDFRLLSNPFVRSSQILLQPGVNFLIEKPAVFTFENPVVLVVPND